MSYKPTEGMVEEAERGLEWRREFGRGGTDVGIARARDISGGKNLSEDTVKRMFSFFSRHEVDKEAEGFRPGEDGYPSNGRIAWALWGGDAGFSWSRQITDRLKAEEERMEERNDAEISDAVEKNLRKQVEEHNEDVGNAESKRTNYRTLAAVFRRGVGAYYTNPESVRPTVKSPEQWAYARVSSYRYALRNGKFRSGKHDTDLLPAGHPMSSKERSMEEMRPYPNEHAARINDPAKYDEFRRENDAGGAGVDFIYGIFTENEERKSELQAIRFDKDQYTMEQARAWLDENNFSPIEFEEATGERMDKRHIVSITETDDSFLIELGKSEMYEGVNLMPEQIEEAEGEEETSAMPEMETERLMKSEKLTRAQNMEAEDVDDRRVRMSISSEAAVERSFGDEVLDHGEGSIDLSFLRSGNAPLLLDHDPEKQIGIIESVELDGSARRLRATVRFATNALADEVYTDVKDGIRKNVSIGYRIDKMVRDDDNPTVYRATSWRPMEASIVALPADVTVGVGRSIESTEEPKVETVSITEVRTMEQQNEQVRDDNVAAYKEVSEILDIAAKHNQRALADECIRKGYSLAEFRGMLLEKLADKPLELNDVDMTPKEERKYSLMRAIRGVATGKFDGLEREVSEELARVHGKDARGFYVPHSIFKRDILTSSPANGSNLVPEDHLADEFIDALRANLVISGLGARMMSGLKGDVAIPALNAKTSVAFVAENNAPSEGAPTFRQVTMTPKTCVSYVDISRKLMMQSDPSVEQILRQDMTQQFASKIDEVAIEGGGANEPTGILGTNGIGSVAIGTNGGAITYASLVDLEREVAIDNALAGNLNYLTNPKVVAEMRQTPRQTSGVEGNFILNDSNTVLGYNVASTTLVPSDLTKGTSSGVCSAVVFGNFADLMIGMFGGLDILVDPYTGSSTGATRIAMYQDIDVAVRHAESFAAIQDVTTT